MRHKPRKMQTVHGFDGSGATLADARKDAIASIERAADANYAPHIVRYRGHTAVVWCDRGHYAYGLLRECDEGQVPYCSTFGYINRDEAILAATWHVVQNGWTVDDGPICPSMLVGTSKERDFTTWAKWQCAYADAKGRGLDDDGCRRHANEVA